MAKKYVVKRNEVCAGSLLMPLTGTGVFFVSDKEVSTETVEEMGIHIDIFGGLVCRGMLFNVDDDNLANDLIYTTPTKYPIKDVEPKIEVQSDLLITDLVELDEVLRYLDYGIDLTQRDLNQIHRRLVTNDRWLNKNHELFGWQETKMGWVSGGTQTLPMETYHKLDSISCGGTGKPHKKEPGYSFIEKEYNYIIKPYIKCRVFVLK